MKKLHRSKTNKTFTGLLGGIGEYLDIDPVIIRIIFIFLLIVSGIWPAVLVYILGWLVVPLSPEHIDEHKEGGVDEQGAPKDTPGT